MINEDGPSALSFVLNLPYEAASRQELIDACGPMAPMFAGRLRRRSDGTWHLPFHPQDTITSENDTHGDHWADWLTGTCPGLLILARHSQALPQEQGHAMAARRPNTRLAELDTDHFIHTADPTGFAKAVAGFLG